MPAGGAQVHDEALVDHGAGEPEPREAGSEASPGDGEGGAARAGSVRGPVSWRVTHATVLTVLTP